MDPVDALKVIAIAALPVSELRGAIPVAIGIYHFSWYHAYLFGVIGNLLPIPFILLLFNGAIILLCRVRFLGSLIQKYLERTQRQKKYVDRFGWLGLTLFVAIPLPATGAWTGTILGAMLRMHPRRILLAVLLGILIAGGIVTAATVLGWAVADMFTA